MVSSIILFVILSIVGIFPTSADAFKKSSSICNIDRLDFGRIESVQITSLSISIHLRSVSLYADCPSVRLDLFIVQTGTSQLYRTIENVQNPTIFIDQLNSNENYSITIQVSNEKNSRILPTYTFQTLYSSNLNVLKLKGSQLLTIDYIQEEVLPHVHLSIVTVPIELQRTLIHGEMTLSYVFDGKQIDHRQNLQPLKSNRISCLGSCSKRSIVFAIDLPFRDSATVKYSSILKLFFPNDQTQSVIYRSGMHESAPPLTAEYSSSRMEINNLCPFYTESKMLITDINSSNETVGRIQCDINKPFVTESDITSGRCSIPLEKLQPEHDYTISIATTCSVINRLSTVSTFVFYDQQRSFSFRTSTGPPDHVPLTLIFHPENKTLSWSIAKTKIQSNTTKPYFGSDYQYELVTRSNENWTLLYRGNRTDFPVPKNFMRMDNVTFRIYTVNRFGRQGNYSGEIELNLKSLNLFNNQNHLVIFMVLISLLLVLLVFVLIFVGYCVRRKAFYGKLKEKCYRNDLTSDKELEHLRSLANSNTLKDNILYTWSHTPTHLDLNKLPKIQRALIKLDRLIGKGAFGEVYAGRLENNQPIAIKTLLASASEHQRTDFLKEAIIMNQFNHRHIVRLMGVCFHQDYQPQYLVLELMDKGDLQNFLRRSRPNQEHHQCVLSYEDCLDIARQISDGACYLEQHGYVHRDLAARNCLVRSSDDGILVKIGDFGLARMLTDQDYYRKTGEALLPVRWMAPESLLDAIFTSNSDIWSFGIVLWEIITLGQVPYSPLSNQQVISLVTTTRGTLEKPNQCTQNLYELMLLCWNYESEKRIHFDEIRSYLDELLSNPGREQPAIWYTYDVSTTTAARNTLDSVLSHIEPPASTSFESSDAGECRSSTSGCFSSMTGSISPMHQHGNSSVVSYQLRLIDDTMSNDFVDEDNHSDIIKQSLQ